MSGKVAISDIVGQTVNESLKVNICGNSLSNNIVIKREILSSESNDVKRKLLKK